MDIRRVGLYAALALVIYSLWSNWQVDYPASSSPTEASMTLLPHSDEPSTPSPSVTTTESTSTTTPSVQKPIRVKTDVLTAKIDLAQGDIVATQLLHYPESVKEKNQPFTLLRDNPFDRYVANSRLFVVNDRKIEDLALHFTSANTVYTMPEQGDTLVVALNGETADGLHVTKEFTFKKGRYLIDVRYVIANRGNASWKGYLNTELMRHAPTEDKSNMFHVGSFTGASYSNPGHQRYKKLTFKDMAKDTMQQDVKGGWIAMQQHYFLTAWIPDAAQSQRFYTRYADDDYMIGAMSPALHVEPQQTKTLHARLYLGPEITDDLKSIAPGLDLTVDYGWLWFLSSFLFSLMKQIFSVVGNWGWSIVLVTVLIKLVFYRLSATSYKSMAGMRKLQPKLMALRERYGDDKAKISQETMALYRQEKVNPLGGCLPIIIQIPVFIALYWVLLESVQLRQAPFMLWITDLATSDPYHVLPIIMGATMLVQQRLNPAPPDPMQAKIMMFLPILFTGLFWNFPAGLVLYWIVNNSLSILQQWYITRKYGENTTTTPKKKITVVK